MTDDPIVASVRAARDQLAAQFDYDVHKIFADLRSRESQLGKTVVPQPPQKPQLPPAGKNELAAPPTGSAPSSPSTTIS